MSDIDPRPIIGLPACVVEKGGMPFHWVGDKYVRAVAVSAGGLPLTIPALPELIEISHLVRQLDGLLLTGSPSNVYPPCYGREASEHAEPFDRERDQVTLPLITAALDDGLPLLAICRGLQELNVALGGTLHTHLHEMDNREDHRRPQHPELDVQYGPKHALALRPGGAFADLFGCDSLEINSLHAQGIDDLAPGLIAEGWAPDQTIEAIRVKDAKAFALGVQWHPEYKSWECEHAKKLFAAFGGAARETRPSKIASITC